MNDGDWEKDENGNYVIDDDGGTVKDYTVRKYRPRTEGLFARIERWTHKTTGDIHWRSISKDNITYSIWQKHRNLELLIRLKKMEMKKEYFHGLFVKVMMTREMQ